MKKYLHMLGIFAILAGMSGCSWNMERLKIDISKITIPQVRIHRYDLDLFKAKPGTLAEDLKKMQTGYSFFLGNNPDDPAKLEQMKEYLGNPRTQDFQRATALKFRDVSSIEKDLTDAFRHFRFYYPDLPVPKFYSYISGGDYEQPVIPADSVIIIALDDYLGKDFKPYFSDGVSQYRAEKMTPEYIVPDIMKVVAGIICPQNPGALTLLDQMMEAGKMHYWIEAMLPEKNRNVQFGYTEKQTEWIMKNEAHVWAAIIENRMLYSTDGKNSQMFLSDGPCTEEFGKDSPPRMGEWIGWKIVKSYMENNPDITLKQMVVERDGQKILTLSGYKPEK